MDPKLLKFWIFYIFAVVPMVIVYNHIE